MRGSLRRRTAPGRIGEMPTSHEIQAEYAAGMDRIRSMHKRAKDERTALLLEVLDHLGLADISPHEFAGRLLDSEKKLDALNAEDRLAALTRYEEDGGALLLEMRSKRPRRRRAARLGQPSDQ